MSEKQDFNKGKTGGAKLIEGWSQAPESVDVVAGLCEPID
jgi:hypothetical protein